MGVIMTLKFDKLKHALGAGVEDALNQLALEAERRAKIKCPIDTGRLRASIGGKLEPSPEQPGDAVYETEKGRRTIGSNVVYAAAQEFREDYHHNTGQAHFLRDAGLEVAEIAESLSQRPIKDAINKL